MLGGVTRRMLPHLPGDPQPRSQGSLLPALRSERERQTRLSLSRSVGRVGKNPGNEVGGPPPSCKQALNT